MASLRNHVKPECWDEIAGVVQLISTGSMNTALDALYPLTHVSQNTKKIELNQTLSLTSSSTDLIENIFLLFPEKYNDFCHRPDYPLDCIKSVTVEIIPDIKSVTVEITSDITDQSFKIIYYPSSKQSLFDETYNTLEYINIDHGNSILIPKVSLKNINDSTIFTSYFFLKQKIIICPIKIKTKTNKIKVSIQRWQETLLSLDSNLDNNINLNSNIKNIINIYCSDLIHLKPLPIAYIGSSMVNINKHIPNYIPKNESLNNVSFDFIQEERKLWSDYKALTRDINNLNKNKFEQKMDGPLCSHLFFVREADLDNIKEITLSIGSQDICRFNGIWLQTRYEEYKLNVDNNHDKAPYHHHHHHNHHQVLMDGFILLPIPPIYDKNITLQYLEFYIYPKNPSMDPPLIYSKSKRDQDNQFIPDDRCMSAVVHVNGNNCIDYHPLHSELHVRCGYLLGQLWGVMTYKGDICPVSSPHPFLKLQLTFNEINITGMNLIDGVLFSEEPAEYYQKVVPLFFEQPLTQKYLVYRMIFHNTPLSFSYPVTKNPYEPAKFISNQYYHSTLNTIHINDLRIKVFWDEEIIKQYYPETDQLKLHFFAESYNLLCSGDGISGLRYDRN